MARKTGDIFTKARLSEVMSRIRSRGNLATEVALSKLFRKHGITGWRRNQNVFGKPDFVFHRVRLAVFVDGCFWHGCPMHGTKPKGNRSFWRNKFAKNKARDRLVTQRLRQEGWQVLRIWEHELAPKNKAKIILKIQRKLSPRNT